MKVERFNVGWITAPAVVYEMWVGDPKAHQLYASSGATPTSSPAPNSANRRTEKGLPSA